jgi:hypothetical protein
VDSGSPWCGTRYTGTPDDQGSCIGQCSSTLYFCGVQFGTVNGTPCNP